MIMTKSDRPLDPGFEKHISKLKEPAIRAKRAVEDLLQKRLKHFQNCAGKSATGKEKSLFLRKSEKISSDLQVLKDLTEDEVIRYALVVLNKIMPIASNPRIPREHRMKARVAAHKPLSTHLGRLKQKLTKDQEEEKTESEEEEDKNSSALNKITFNNTIVLMRKDVRRAKVHIIHKLTRTIKKLRMAKGKEEKVEKFKRKAERLHKKIIHIKELHEDEISKFALSTTQNVSQLATDIKAPSTSQALATVAIQTFVANHVKDFRTKYPYWQTIVPKLLKKKNKKRKLKMETKDDENTCKRVPLANIENDQSEMESEDDLSEHEKDSSEIENSSSEDENEENSANPENEVEEESEIDYEGSLKGDDENSRGSEDEVSNASENEISSVENAKCKNSKTKKKLDEETKRNLIILGKQSRISANTSISESKKTKKKTAPFVEAKPVADKPKVVDPFFVTATNEEYVTSQVPIAGEENSSGGNNKSFLSNKSSKFINCDYKNKWERTTGEGKYGKFNRFESSAPYKELSTGGFDKNSGGQNSDKLVFGNRKERRKALHQPQVEEKVEKLHPSWEAKKKQSSIIPFQGKKVTFD